jgi:predicted GIY-YIG superfamily endonuclease
MQNIIKYGRSMIKQKENSYNPWSVEDDKLLLKQVDDGLAVEFIAEHFNRTHHAITSRIRRLTQRSKRRLTKINQSSKNVQVERLVDEPTSGVYVLQKEDGSFYVGKSKNIANRLKQHIAGVGAVCALGSVFRVPAMTAPILNDFEAWERSETLARMRYHGISMVRGWMYTSEYLDDSQREHAFQQICEKCDLCRKCGGEGHFAAQCKLAAGCNFFKKNRPAWALV